MRKFTHVSCETGAPMNRPARLARVALPALGLLLAYPLLQLVPLPFSVWSALPGHEPYVRVLAQLPALFRGSHRSH